MINSVRLCGGTHEVLHAEPEPRSLTCAIKPRYSPHGSLQPVKFFTGVDDFPMFVSEDVRSEVEADIPVVLHLLQTALPP